VDHLTTVANQFKPQGQVIHVQEHGRGNINHTFLVTLDALTEPYFILQRINTAVFRQPALIMQNMRIFSDHVCDRLRCSPLESDRCWEVPRILSTQTGADFWVDAEGAFWRAISFIETTESFDQIQNSQHAQEIGYALGTFHTLISDLPTEKLADTLEGFHITPSYLQHYQTVLAKWSGTPSPEIKYGLQFISDRQAWSAVLENAKAEGKLQLRPTHGDPKINNILIHAITKKAISMIDLDTVKPALVHYDIGDCLRSGCNPLGEETQHWEKVDFDTGLCQAILQGYLAVAKQFLTSHDYNYLYDAIRLIAFELGLRFFTDYLAGNVYFKVKDPEHNLLRALVQFKLTESIESQEKLIRAIVQDMRP
jgi:Ser/Thr protein kinase RdoA (MazF antagonist)